MLGLHRSYTFDYISSGVGLLQVIFVCVFTDFDFWILIHCGYYSDGATEKRWWDIDVYIAHPVT